MKTQRDGPSCSPSSVSRHSMTSGTATGMCLARTSSCIGLLKARRWWDLDLDLDLEVALEVGWWRSQTG